MEKIYPPIYWKTLDYKKRHQKKKTIVQSNQRSCSDGFHYTTLIHKTSSEKEFRIFIDLQHNELQHSTWKELINKNEDFLIKTKSSIIEPSWLNLNNQQQSLNDYHLKRQELHRYFKNHLSKDKLFQLDENLYPNLSKPISRRPRDTLHVDFYQADHLKGSKIDATFKTFFHRKYLVNKFEVNHKGRPGESETESAELE